ncbi:lipopolysaccharide biosynthesis protein [Methylophilus sp. DW102]|uniref:lipopolysaccharide biosynthesis protein n=1 Tax=Methylophilus sp. DW102 TaxID=3095607 RepID=UPI00308AD204|nr:lipopolysaccharide biosynthesis protein [Methylophilus sp. DW102]
MKKDLLKGALWLSAAKLLVNIIAFISTIVFARILLPDDFGLVSFALAIFGLITAVTDLSLASALVQKNEIHEEHFHTAFTMNAIRGGLVAFILFSAAPFITQSYGDHRLELILRALSVVLLISGFGNPKIVTFTRNLKFWQEFVINVTQKLLGFLVGVAIGYLYHSYWALVIAGIVHQLTGLIVSYILIPYKPKFSLVYVKDLWSFSVWLTLCQAAININMKFDQFLIGSKLGNNTLGIYSVGDNLSTTPTREMIAPIEATLFPAFSKIGSDIPRLQKAYLRSQGLIAFIAIPVGVTIALFSDLIIHLFLGERWIGAATVMQYIAVLVSLQTLASPAHQLAMSQGMTKNIFYRDMATLLVRIPLLIIGYISNGLIGILIARFTSNFFTILLNMLMVKKILSVPLLIQIDSNMRTIAGALIMSLTILLLKEYVPIPSDFVMRLSYLIFGGLASIVIYLSVTFGLNAQLRSVISPEHEIIKLIESLKEKIKKST